MKHWENKEFVAEDLVDKIRSKDILVSQYQRGQVWKEPAQKSLIDSIKRGFPFGTILLYLDPEDHKYRLIDGLQRCTTISKYINNPALIFNKDVDVNDITIQEIINLVPTVQGNTATVMKMRISEIIENWVLNSHDNMSDIQGMQYARCVRKITEALPIFKDFSEEIENIIEPMLEDFKIICTDLSTAKIPAIVYKGEQNNLPEIFTRINAQGIQLSKYQILAATWSHIDYKIDSDDLKDIHIFVEEYFVNLFSDDDSYTLEETERAENILNLFQILFGFSKTLSSRYELLFNGNKESEVESAAFNLITACVGLNNNNMKELDEELKKHFKTHEEFNLFLEKVLVVTNRVNNLLKTYLSFKNNSREKSKISYYHTEMQICSIIANTFFARYVNLFDDDHNEVFEIHLDRNNRSWKCHDNDLSDNLMKRYLIVCWTDLGEVQGIAN